MINLIYETFNPEIHDVFKVASLSYDVDFRTFDLFFKNKDEAIKAIAKSFQSEDCDIFIFKFSSFEFSEPL